MRRYNKKILITGGAGYIGLNLINFFLNDKYQITVIDNLSTSRPINKEIKKYINFFKIDLTNKNQVKKFFKQKKFDAIIHLAAYSGVEEFNKNVSKSFNNNVIATKNLLTYGFSKKSTKLIFASSAAVYGKVSNNKISEKNICNPVNYYGLSKYACENIIYDHFQNQKTQYAILRYFNVVGSILTFKIFKNTKNLLDIISDNIKNKKYKINVNGNKHNTKDGTPERDFIHINDLCKIHKKTFLYLNNTKKNIVLNCGSGTKYSVLKIIREFEKEIQRKFKLSFKIKNLNETETICSDMSRLKTLLKIDIKKKGIYNCIKDYL